MGKKGRKQNKKKHQPKRDSVSKTNDVVDGVTPTPDNETMAEKTDVNTPSTENLPPNTDNKVVELTTTEANTAIGDSGVPLDLTMSDNIELTSSRKEQVGAKEDDEVMRPSSPPPTEESASVKRDPSKSPAGSSQPEIKKQQQEGLGEDLNPPDLVLEPYDKSSGESHEDKVSLCKA